MSHTLQFGRLSAADHEAVSGLLHRSLVKWYESRLGQGARFGDSPAPFLLFPQVYEALDPGEAITARDEETQAILGICFTHERETHLSIGIVATSPEASGKGIARQMMQAALDKAQHLGKPARLVSSLLNLDSFSLYTRLGFIPGPIFQDVQFNVPETGLTIPVPEGHERVRLAGPEDVKRIADFEFITQSIRREKDFHFFLRNQVGDWRVFVQEDAAGSLTGYMVVSTHPSCCMIGPGAATDEDAATALIWQSLETLRGRTTVILVPCLAARLVKTLYRWGGRNVELHVAQSTAIPPKTTGLAFPTFLPESA
ncbi:GNAT family N-acetyltransferase [Prosthecobacter dejongeii]|uniref:GNAT superfamily N-acetyltransferase n=1 Tax=Prosthecobacter dejongeii TaxID=48465 RepID=A0A7W7YIQ3_9BACT|nr:GNAT family N-acetyltransferase [Prosthecobacter dejongeii]MBB5036985.1 GNAT superfamily N-acetyltransferase [Prosthecobacter dejongeii]